MDINREINRLLHFAQQQGLIGERDRIYAANRLIYVLRVSEFIASAVDESLPTAEPVLDNMLIYAVETGLCDDTYTERELLKVRLMDCVMPRPSEVEARFWADYAVSPEQATTNFFRFCQATNYIQVSREQQSISWQQPSEYGNLQVTINLSKPDRDLAEIADIRTRRRNDYPWCPLCCENEGYAGNAHREARRTLRLISLELAGRRWYWQFSPYLYYPEHSILLAAEHVPINVSRETFRVMMEFLTKFPHYFIGLGADLPILGGALQAHGHFLTGSCHFPIEEAPFEKEYTYPGFDTVRTGRLHWQPSVIRLRSADVQRLTVLADKIRRAWSCYTDKNVSLLAETDGVPHHTMTAVARRRGEEYELDLVLRSNLQTKERPRGVFFQKDELRHIKKEPLGITEVQGLEILPPRLMQTMNEVREELLRGSTDIEDIRSISKHNDWYKNIRAEYPDLSDDIIDGIMHDEIGKVFIETLDDIAVFKRDAKGLRAFDKFMRSV